MGVQIWSSGKPPGVVRSPLQPEETRGLTRSDDLSRMLPFEAHLMAAGWPKNGTDEEGNEVVREGSRPARLLHMVRRAERNLMSYERTGMSSSCQYRNLTVRPYLQITLRGCMPPEQQVSTVGQALRSNVCILLESVG